MKHKDAETRTYSVDELRVDAAGEGSPKITGHAAVFDKLSLDLGGFRERIKPGAFANSLKRGDDIRALVDHDPSRIIARTKSKTLTLSEDKTGLKVDIKPANTSHGRDIVESIKRGDVDQMSFGFRTVTDAWHEEDGETIRELVEVDLFDVSTVSFPAYTDTDVAVRGLEAFKKGERKDSIKPKKRFSEDSESLKRKAAIMKMVGKDG